MSGAIAELSRADCLEHLAAQTVGRVALTHHALPAIVPVNYVLAGGRIIFRTEPDGMLAHGCDGTVIAFEIDDIDADGCGGWSVLVVGIAELLDGSAALRALEENVVAAAGEGRDQFVAVGIGQISGRTVGRAIAHVPAQLSRRPATR